MLKKDNFLKFIKLILFNFLTFIFISSPLYLPLLVVGIGINKSLDYQKYILEKKELPDISALDQLKIYFARILYHKAPYRNILTINKDCFAADKEFLYRPIAYSSCIQSSLEFENEINFGDFGNRIDNFFKVNKKIDLITIGDSHALGWGVGDEEVFTSYLNKDGINTLNLSVPSYGTYRQLKLLKKWSTEYPKKYQKIDHIVLQYCLNDLSENIYGLSNQKSESNVQTENYKFELLFIDNPYHIKFKQDWGPLYKNWDITSRTLNVFYSYFPKKIINSENISQLFSSRFKIFKKSSSINLNSSIHIENLTKILEENRNLLKGKTVYIFISNPYGYHVKEQSEIFSNFLNNYNNENFKIIFLPSSLTKLDSYKSYYLLDDHISPHGHFKIYQALKKAISL